jgi:hypothetical protein
MFPFCMGRWLENVDNYLWIRNSWGFELSFSDERAASTGFVCLLDGEDSGEAVMLLHKYLKTLEFPPWNYYMWMDSFSLQWKSMKSYPAWLFYYSFSRFILLTVKLRSCFTGLLHTVFFFFFCMAWFMHLTVHCLKGHSVCEIRSDWPLLWFCLH